MATRTSIGTGLWSAVGTWDTGVPLDNDVVVIAAGHVVTFDVDQSGFANGIDGITITGTLKLTRTAGTYYLKVKAAKTIGGAGTFDCGTLADPIPFAAKHTITGGAGWYIKCDDGVGLTMTVYAAEPVIKTIKLTAQEPNGETVLAVDTDVTGDIWADGDYIRIDNVNKASNGELRVIAAGGIAAGTITITAGLTATKVVGSLIHLATRNVRFISNGTYSIQAPKTGKLTIAGGEFTAATAHGCIYNGTEVAVSGGILHSAASGIYNSYRTQLSGGVISGCTYALQACVGSLVSGGIISASSTGLYSSAGTTISGGIITGCGYAINSVGTTIIGGEAYGNSYGLGLCSANINGGNFHDNTWDLNTMIYTAFNTLFASSENTGYTTLSESSYSESFNHDQVAGAFKSWTAGGITSSASATPPTGYTQYNQTVLGNATKTGYWQKEVLVNAGASVSMDLWLRKDASMTYLPNCIIFNKASTDPFAGGTGVHTFTMTNSIDTWEQETYVYTNTTANSVSLIVRFQGKNATGNFFSAITLDVLNVDLTTLITSTNALTATVANIANDVWSASSTTDYGDSTMGKHVSKKLLKQANFIALK